MPLRRECSGIHFGRTQTQQGIAATSQTLASQAAVQILARGGTADIMIEEADVSLQAAVSRIADAAFKRFEDIAFLMNNAAAFEGGCVAD